VRVRVRARARARVCVCMCVCAQCILIALKKIKDLKIIQLVS